MTVDKLFHHIKWASKRRGAEADALRSAHSRK
jgi:hypothetical protein